LHLQKLTTQIIANTIIITIAPAVITIHPQSVAVYNGGSVTLSCEAKGSNPITYQWRRVKGNITSNSSGVNTSTLTLLSVREQDEDEYYCIASNGVVVGLKVYMNISQKANVTVYGKLVLY